MDNAPRYERRRAGTWMLLLAGLVLMLLLAPGCGAGRELTEAFNPSWSPGGEAIAYVVDPDPSAGCPYGSCAERFELWVMGADGRNARKLARGAYGGLLPIWSPDGSTIAFERYRLDDGGEMYSVHADGSRLRRLTRTPWGVAEWPAAWSPDGSKLLFISNQLYVMNADGSARRRLSGLEPYEASWSGDGARIAFTTFDGLFAIDAEGRGLKKLYGTPHGGIGGIGWSPDARRIAFGVDGGFAVVHVTGTVVVRPRTGGYRWDPGYEMDASWSPDRRVVAYGRPEGGIDLVAVNGRIRKRLSAAGWNPSWSPDGQRIAFAEDGSIYVVKIDGTGRRKLTERVPARPE